MRLTIVKPDNMTIIDGEVQQFDLDEFEHPDDLWALQWQQHIGEVEYQGNQPNETITELPDWTMPIVQEHERLTRLQHEQQALEEKQAVFVANGQARKERLQQQEQERLLQQQKMINDRVLETL